MKQLIIWVIGVIFMAITLSLPLYADTTSDTSSDNATNSNNTSSSTSTTSNNLESKINTKTNEAMKTFKNFKFEDQAKQDFFDDVGKDPSSDEFDSGSFGSGGYSDQDRFKIKDSSDDSMLGR